MEAFGPWAGQPWAYLPAGTAATQAIVVMRLANAGYATSAADDPAHTPYSPRIMGDIEISQSAVDAFGVGGRVAIGIGEFATDDADLFHLAPIVYGTADGRGATVRVLPVANGQATNFGTPYGSARIAFRGILGGIHHASGSRARVVLADASQRLAVKLQASLFSGSGGLGGPATLANRPKPVCLGDCTNVTPVAVGSVDLGAGSLPTYVVHSGAVNAISAVRIRGVAQALVGGTPGVGQARVFTGSGAFQLGSSPDGIVTADVQGDSTGGYVSSTAGVLRRLLQSFGPLLSTAQLNVPSFDFSETDLPGDVGYWQGPDEITAADAIDRILAGSGAILAGGRDGTLRLVDPLAQGDSQFVLTEGLIAELEPVDLPAALRPLPWSVLVDWAPNSTPMTDFAGSVTDSDRARFSAAARGPVRSESSGIYTRVAQRRELRLPGRYLNSADAQARADRWRGFFEGAPRIFRITTDRYLGRIEIGDLGAIAYPTFGLYDGAGVVVLGWQESLAARRLTLTVATVPWVTYVPPPAPDPFFILDEDLLA
jgi:hypothetical protein